MISPGDSAAAGREPLEGDDQDQVKHYRDRRDWENTGSAVVTATLLFREDRIQ